MTSFQPRASLADKTFPGTHLRSSRGVVNEGICPTPCVNGAGRFSTGPGSGADTDATIRRPHNPSYRTVSCADGYHMSGDLSNLRSHLLRGRGCKMAILRGTHPTSSDRQACSLPALTNAVAEWCQLFLSKIYLEVVTSHK